MINDNRTLSDAELDLVSGGLKDRPWNDYLNKLGIPTGGFGASLVDVSPGLVMKDGGPNSPGRPISGL
jgi:hypothetical protein